MESFSYYSIPSLISAVLFFILGFIIFLRNKKLLTNILFSLICFATFWWQFSWFVLFNISNETIANYLVKIGYIGIIFIPIFFFHFFIVFLKDIKKFDKYLLYLSYASGFLFVISLFFNYFINGYYEYFWGFYPKAGLIHPIYLIFLSILALRILFLLFYTLKKEREVNLVRYSQVKYMLWAMIFYILASSDFVVNYSIEFYPIGFIFILIFLGIVAYTITRYRLMDIRVIMGKTAVYLFSYLIVVILGIFMMFLNSRIETQINMFIFGPIILIITISIFQPIFRFFEYLFSKYFYYTYYSYQRVLSDLGRNMVRLLDINKLSSLVVNTLINIIKLDKVVVILKNPDTGIYEIKKNIGFEQKNGISLVKDSFLTEYLEKTQQPLVYEELSLIAKDNENQKEKIGKLKEEMKRIGASVCLPLITEDKIIGIIVMGNKLSKNPYSQQDIELLISLSSQASIALQNARLYQEIKEFSENLQQKVDEQTKEIKKSKEEIERAYNIEKKAKEDLEKLDEVKSQFALATQHHLRTPLTSMQGYIDLLLGGSFGRLPIKAQKCLKKLQDSTQDEIKIVEELLNISQLQMGKEITYLEPNVKIEEILKEIINNIKIEAKEKGIYLKFKKSKETPTIKADKYKLKVALSNIIDNAVKYTNKGGVEVTLEVRDNKVMLIVRDTGIGILKKDIGNLFDRIFERSEKAQEVFTTGRGIGLYISAKIIEAHEGKVWAESKGQGRGSTFIAEFPIE